MEKDLDYISLEFMFLKPSNIVYVDTIRFAVIPGLHTLALVVMKILYIYKESRSIY